MGHRKAITEDMTAQHWEVLARIERQLAARRYEGRQYPKATPPYDRPENATRRVSLPRRA